MVVLAQSVRAPDCGSGGRGFEPHIPPQNKKSLELQGFFYVFSGDFSFVSLISHLFYLIYYADYLPQKMN